MLKEVTYMLRGSMYNGRRYHNDDFSRGEYEHRAKECKSDAWQDEHEFARSTASEGKHSRSGHALLIRQFILVAINNNTNRNPTANNNTYIVGR